MAKNRKTRSSARGGYDRDWEGYGREFGRGGETAAREVEGGGWGRGEYESPYGWQGYGGYGRAGEFGYGYGGTRYRGGIGRTDVATQWSPGGLEPTPQGRGMRGRGPKGFQRSDDRIRERVSEVLEDDDNLDATEIEVRVSGGEITLTGTVQDRSDKRLAEDLIENLPGVREVHNQLRISRGGEPRAEPTRPRARR